MTIVINSVIVFVLVWLVVRVVGKREMSQLSPFDLVILIVLGDLVAEGVISEDTSVTGAVIAVATFGVLTVALSWISWRLPQKRAIFEGLPTLLIRNGEILDEALKVERLNEADLLEAARQEGISTLEGINWAVLEQDGNFSFFRSESED